jgi:hypothetical protein
MPWIYGRSAQTRPAQRNGPIPGNSSACAATFRRVAADEVFEMVEMKRCDCFERLKSSDTGTCPDPIDRKGHRYLFWDRWGSEPALIIIMLNPAGHRAGESGRTRDRVESFARQMDAGGVITANAFALCSPKPECLGLVDRDRAVGLENDAHLQALRAMSPRIVVA